VFKRSMLILAFVATFGAASLCLTDNADARRWGWNRPYATYYGPRAYVPVRPFYGGYYAPAPNVYGYPGYYYRPGPRIAVRVGPWWW
jgi:hypothetical protein